MGLLGEVGEHLALVARGDADQPAVLGREQDAPLPEAGDEGRLDLPGGRMGVVHGALADGDGDGVGAGEEQTEAFGPFGEPAQVAAAVEEVVDELAAGRLLLTHRELLGAFVSLGEGVHRVLDHREQAVGAGGGQARPELPGDREVPADEGAQPVSRLGRALTLRPQRLQLVPGETSAGRADLPEDPRVLRQFLLARIGPRHVRPRPQRSLPPPVRRGFGSRVRGNRVKGPADSSRSQGVHARSRGRRPWPHGPDGGSRAVRGRRRPRRAVRPRSWACVCGPCAP